MLGGCRSVVEVVVAEAVAVLVVTVSLAVAVAGAVAAAVDLSDGRWRTRWTSMPFPRSCRIELFRQQMLGRILQRDSMCKLAKPGPEPEA